MSGTIRVAVAGVGGFAAEHHEALAALEAGGECRVVGTCDPSAARLQAASERFAFGKRGVQEFNHLSAMLDALRPDVVTLPTPIPLHAEQHRLAVESGAAVYLEKPPTLWWPEFVSMLRTEGEARHATNVGFNFVGDPFRQALKGRIVGGEFGCLREATLVAYWPRDRAYYGRNDWGGRLRSADGWVLDGCIGNALAHYVQNLLFWCGSSAAEEVGKIANLQAKMYRAHDIESYDTCFVAAEMDDGARLRIAATHTGTERHGERESLVFERARVVFDRWRRARMEHVDGRVELIESEFQDQGALLRHNLRSFLAYARGERPRPTTRLSEASSLVALSDLAFVSSGTIEAFARDRVSSEESGRVKVEGLDEEMEAFVTTATWPGDPGALAEPTDLDHLPRAVERLLGR